MTEADIAEYINRCHDKEDRKGDTALDASDKIITLISTLDFEITLGGFWGFYSNSAGDKTIKMLNALIHIGASQAANALRQSLALFPEPDRINQRDYRQDYLPHLSSEFRHLEKHYEQQTPSVRELLMNYVRVNHHDPLNDETSHA